MERTSLTVETVEHNTETRAFHLRLTGELDLDSATALSEQFDDCIEQGATLIIVDASDVAFMDSTGLRAIVTAGNKLAANGGRLLIEGISGAVQRVLEISGLLERYRQA